MPVSILRWKGGSGGDMILYMLSTVYPVLNTRYVNISDSGRTEIDFSWIDFNCLTELQKISLRQQYISQVNLSALRKEIKQQTSGDVWIKSHYYGTNEFNDITTDIVVDPVSLPFVVRANIEKTETLTLPFNKLLSKINDKELKIKYAMFLVASDFMKSENVSNKVINVSDLFERIKLQSVLEENNMIFNNDYYDTWLSYNLSYLPSNNYQKKIANQDYDFMDMNLSLAERYSLLVLSQSKFKIL